jgi:hypothetical protein
MFVNCACRNLQHMGRLRHESRSTAARMVEKKKVPKKRGKRSPIGDRRQFLMMMSPDHADGIVAMDLFVVPTISFRLLYVC